MNQFMLKLKAPSLTDRYDHWLTTALSTLLWLWVPQEAAILARSLPMKNRKSWSRDVFYAFASHTCLVHDVTDTDGWEQNGGIHGRDFATFKHQFLTHRARKRVKTNKNCSASSFDSTYSYGRGLWGLLASQALRLGTRPCVSACNVLVMCWK